MISPITGSGAVHPSTPARRRHSLRARASLVRELADPDLVSRMTLHYQPILSMATGRVVGAEALLRWNRWGAVLPASCFIDLVHARGRTEEIEHWTLARTLRESRAWREAGWKGWISVNASVETLAAPDLEFLFRRLVEESGGRPEDILVEVTERTTLTGNGALRRGLDALRGLGARVALDDFGSGYANFRALQALDPDVVKLDRAFVVGDGSTASARMLGTLVDLLRGPGRTVVVEGVERHTEWHRAVTSRCDLVQGYLVGRPVPPADFYRRFVEPANAEPVAMPAYARPTLASSAA